jgi:hypothetical protein
MEHIFNMRYVNIKKSFSDIPKVLVSDKEYYGHELMHNTETVHCWHHLRKNIEFTAHKKHLSAKDVESVKNDFNEMIASRSQESYIARRNAKMQLPHWRNTGMSEYYMREVDKDLLLYSGRWILKKYNLGVDHRGMTNNPAETLNSSIAKLTQKHEKRPKKVAEGIVALYNYAQHADKEIESAYFGGTSTYQVHKDFAFLKKNIDKAPSVDIQTVDEILDHITTIMDLPHDKQQTETPTKYKNKPSNNEELLEELAQIVVDQDRVFDVPGRDMLFGVRDIETDHMMWVEYLKDTCTCPQGNKFTCIHKVAVKLRYNFVDPSKKKVSKLPLAFNPTLSKVPVYGTKKPTRDDTYDLSLHGVKKPPKRVMSKREKELLDIFMATVSDPKDVIDAKDAKVTKVDPPPTVPSTPLTIHEQVMTTNDCNLNANDISVRTDESKLFTYGGTEKFAIYRPSNNRVMVFYKPKDERRIKETKMIKTLAMSARSDATYETYSKNRPIIQVCFKELLPTKDLKTELQAYHDRPFAEKLNIFKPDVRVELGCHCRIPMASTTASGTNEISCKACLATYHIDCLSKNEQDKATDKKNWQCTPCGLPRNVEWQHQDVVQNTCTIDNFFQSLVLNLKDNKNLLNHFPTDEAHECLSECVHMLLQNRCFEAQGLWNNYMRANYPDVYDHVHLDNDMWGSTNEVAYDALTEGQSWNRRGLCNNINCKRPVYSKENRDWFMIRIDEGSFNDQIAGHVGENDSPCERCKNGTVTWEKLTMAPGKNTWFIKFSGTGNNHETHKDDYHKLPQTLMLPDESGKEHLFKLQSATVHWHNHFVSLQNYNGRMILFDGMGERGSRPFPRRFREAMPSDTDFNGPKRAILQNILYVRQFE